MLAKISQKFPFLAFFLKLKNVSFLRGLMKEITHTFHVGTVKQSVFTIF
jgi:hypothetical protein